MDKLDAGSELVGGPWFDKLTTNGLWSGLWGCRAAGDGVRAARAPRKRPENDRFPAGFAHFRPISAVFVGQNGPFRPVPDSGLYGFVNDSALFAQRSGSFVPLLDLLLRIRRVAAARGSLAVGSGPGCDSFPWGHSADGWGRCAPRAGGPGRARAPDSNEAEPPRRGKVRKVRKVIKVRNTFPALELGADRPRSFFEGRAHGWAGWGGVGGGEGALPPRLRREGQGRGQAGRIGAHTISTVEEAAAFRFFTPVARNSRNWLCVDQRRSEGRLSGQRLTGRAWR
jgi:hypothetical protein